MSKSKLKLNKGYMFGLCVKRNTLEPEEEDEEERGRCACMCTIVMQAIIWFDMIWYHRLWYMLKCKCNSPVVLNTKFPVSQPIWFPTYLRVLVLYYTTSAIYAIKCFHLPYKIHLQCKYATVHSRQTVWLKPESPLSVVRDVINLAQIVTGSV